MPTIRYAKRRDAPTRAGGRTRRARVLEVTIPASAGQLPGVRSYVQAASGVTAIPVDRAASAGVSALRRYEGTG